MTRKEQLQEQAKAGGLIVREWSPGDGVTRYRFFHDTEERQTYFGPKNGLFTALGIREAESFLGFRYQS
ncbi:hypothetical protein LCGC14_1807920 [marine sediment metagenome]|uniref:Uncharacterized protein n=1 Tax=marine sediment metagenome TaxID=412755 RepID=A0A0F9GMU1_9ZZZZ